jgi:hypothetical protein
MEDNEFLYYLIKKKEMMKNIYWEKKFIFKSISGPMRSEFRFFFNLIFFFVSFYFWNMSETLETYFKKLKNLFKKKKLILKKLETYFKLSICFFLWVYFHHFFLI